MTTNDLPVCSYCGLRPDEQRRFYDQDAWYVMCSRCRYRVCADTEEQARAEWTRVHKQESKEQGNG